jgi:DNA-binding SARP family transcriptional activator
MTFGQSSFRPVFPAAPAARLKLYLLGPPQIVVNHHKMLGLRGEKSLVLLAYLAVETRRPHRRSELAALLWPEQARTQALQNLRQTLNRLRRAIEDRSAEPAHLFVDAEMIQFNCHSDFWLDTQAFTEILAGVRCCPHARLDLCPACMSQLVEAFNYYRGEFAATLNPSGSQALDDWLLFQREALERQACAALYALASAHLALHELDAAQEYVRLLLRLDQWHEAGLRLLLRILMLRQERAAAIRSYNAFRRALFDELNLEPERATLDLIAEIRAGRTPTAYTSSD